MARCYGIVIIIIMITHRFSKVSPPQKRALWLNTMCAVKHNGVIIFRCGRRREICVLNEKVTNKQNSREFRQKHRGRVRTREREWARARGREGERKRKRDWRMKSTEHHRVCSEHAAGQVSIVKPHYRCNYQAKNIMWDGGVSECIQYRPPLYKVNPRVYVKVVRVTADRAAREGKRFVFPAEKLWFSRIMIELNLNRFETSGPTKTSSVHNF